MYDVILQAGHEGRTSGVTGAAANGLKEITLTPRITDAAAQVCREADLNVLRISADGLSKQSTKLAVAVHLDGTPTSGAQLLYDDETDRDFARYLRTAYARHYKHWIADNTSPLADNTGFSRYYGFRYWVTSDAEVVIEMGSIGDPDQAALWKQPGYPEWAGRVLGAAICRRLGKPVDDPGPFNSPTYGTPILGPATVTPAHAYAWFDSRVTWDDIKHSPYQVREIINKYWSIATPINVRPEVCFTQACKETGFFQYGGQVSPDQFNFAGIGAIPDGVTPGEEWPTIEAGVQGHVYRVALYAIDDPFYHNLNVIKRSLGENLWGIHKTVEHMGRTWSGFDNGYGESLVKFYLNPLLAFEYADEPSDLEPWAYDAWDQMRKAEVLSTSSQPNSTVTDQRLAVFLSRFNKAQSEGELDV